METIENEIAGAYNDDFKISRRIITEVHTLTIEDKRAEFEITTGPLIHIGTLCENTYVLEIYYYSLHTNHQHFYKRDSLNPCPIDEFIEKETKKFKAEVLS